MDSPEGPKDAAADASRRSRSTRETEETIARLHCEILKDGNARDFGLWRFRLGRLLAAKQAGIGPVTGLRAMHIND